jgi:bifunctional DNA-binding transcriptional regulator/antitoxin component of YhaV-PrlF toxin-antitoxin module
MNAMKISIDSIGRILLPESLRRRFGLRPNRKIEIVEQPNGILPRVADHKPSVNYWRGLLIHQGRAKADANWDVTLKVTREERLQQTLKA